MDSLTVKYRPQNWNQIIGQEHVVEALKNSCKTNKLANAYLFIGTMGTGKTTTARVLAKTLNCAQLVDGEPCNECPSCKSIMVGNSLDVKELDMATNRGIDDVRILREFAQYSATGGKYRVFICDEAHQLTSQAASALLKILEEPPKNVIFILCTTELQKILGTIRSRCQVYSFKRVGSEEIVNRLSQICEVEEMNVTSEVLNIIVKHSDGSVRNAESRLSNLISGGNVTLEAYIQMFGSGDTGDFADFIHFAMMKDKIQIVEKFKKISEEIVDPAKWCAEFAKYLFEELLKDEKNNKFYLAFLDVVEDYLVHLYQNQPMVFLELMLIKLANVEVKFEGINNELQKYVKHKADIWDLARWFNTKEVVLEGYGHILTDIDGISIMVCNNAELYKGGLPRVDEKDIKEIIGLSQDIDKNVLVEKGLVLVD